MGCVLPSWGLRLRRGTGLRTFALRVPFSVFGEGATGLLRFSKGSRFVAVAVVWAAATAVPAFGSAIQTGRRTCCGDVEVRCRGPVPGCVEIASDGGEPLQFCGRGASSNVSRYAGIVGSRRLPLSAVLLWTTLACAAFGAAWRAAPGRPSATVPDRRAERDDTVGQLIDQMPIMVAAMDSRGVIVFWNRECELITGYSAAEIVNNPQGMAMLYPDRRYRETMLQKLNEQIKSFRNWEWVATCKDGAIRTIAWSVITAPSPVKSGIVWGVGVDVSDRKRAEHHAARLGRLLEESVNEIYVFDAQSLKLLDVNRGARENLGFTLEELRERTLLDLIPDCTAESFEALLSPLRAGRGPSIRIEAFHRRKDGSTYPVEVHLQYSGLEERPVFVAMVLDISIRRRAEELSSQTQQVLLEQQRRERERIEEELAKVREQLVRQTTLATLGQLAGSIAHELRNPLGAIRNAAYFLRGEPIGRDPLCQRHLAVIEDEVSAADRIIRDLLDMTRSRVPVRERVNLGEILHAVVQRAAVPPGVHCNITLDSDPFIVQADALQLRQLLGNLVANAAQALGGAGQITLAARRDGEYDVILISDSGPGVQPDIRHRIFEPLFSTKAKGTGLGLAVCRQIVERHGGDLTLLDDGTPGATFRVRLPRTA